MPSDYIIRLYQPGDEEGIVHLLESVFNGWPHFDLSCSPLEHWRWKYQDNPLKLKAVALCVSDNEIIGCDHGYYVNLKMGKKIRLCQQGADSAIHKDLRGKGVYSRVNAEKNELMYKLNTDCTYWATNVPVLKKMQKNREYPSFPQPVIFMVRIQDVSLHLKMNTNISNPWLKDIGFNIVKMINRARTKLSSSTIYSKDYSIYQIKKFDNRINTFWDNIKEYYNFIVERNKDYLNWRYCDIRGGNYIVKQIEAEDNILGYSVLRVNRYRKEYPEGYIVDLITLPQRPDIVNILIEDAIKYFNNKSINIIYSWIIKKHPYEGMFNNYAFINSRKRINVGYRLLNIKNEVMEFQTSLPEHLHLHIGDTDWI